MLPPVRQSIALGLLVIGFVMTGLGMFVSNWWQVEWVPPERIQDDQNFQAAESQIGFGNSLSLYESQPYVSGAANDLDRTLDFIEGFSGGGSGFDQAIEEPRREFEKALDSEALTAGITVSVGLVLQAGAAGAMLGSYFVPLIKPWMGHALSFVAILVGLTIVVLAPLTWPSAYEREMEESSRFLEILDLPADFQGASWWGSEPVNPDATNPEDDQGTINYRPNWGWYLTIVGIVALPAAAMVLQFAPQRERDEELEPERTSLGPAAPPPPLPSASGPPPLPPALPARPVPSFRPAAAVAPYSGGTGPRRLSVIQKSGPTVAAPKRKAPAKRE